MRVRQEKALNSATAIGGAFVGCGGNSRRFPGEKAAATTARRPNCETAHISGKEGRREGGREGRGRRRVDDRFTAAEAAAVPAAAVFHIVPAAATVVSSVVLRSKSMEICQITYSPLSSAASRSSSSYLSSLRCGGNYTNIC